MPPKINPYIYRTTSLSLSLSPRASVYIEGSKFSPFIYRAKKTARKRRGEGGAGPGRQPPREPDAPGPPPGRERPPVRAAGGETATIPGGRPERTGEPPAGDGPPGETHFPAPLCRPGGPADLPDVPIGPEGGKKPVRGSESKAGISQNGPASRRPGIDPRVKRTPPRPCAGPAAPQTSRTPQSARRTSKRLYAALRAKPGYPGRGRSPGRGAPGQSTSCEPLCRPSGPGPPGNVPNHPEGGKKPVRGSGSETGASPQGETPARPGASRPRPEHRPASRAGPGRARREQSHGQPGAMNPSSEDGNRGRDRRLPRPRPGAVRKERRRRAAPAGRPSGR